MHYQGAIAWQRGAVEEAEAHFQRALELARALMDVAAEARAFNNLGILRNLLGVSRTRRWRTTSWPSPPISRTATCAAWPRPTPTWRSAGWRWETRTAPGSAADEAVRLAREVGDQTLIGLALVARAEASLALGRSGARAGRAADAPSRRTRASSSQPASRSCAASRPRWPARAQTCAGAKRLLEQARALAPGGASLDTQAEIERDLGDTLAALGDAVGARAARERALALFRRLGARHAEQAAASSGRLNRTGRFAVAFPVSSPRPAGGLGGRDRVRSDSPDTGRRPAVAAVPRHAHARLDRRRHRLRATPQGPRDLLPQPPASLGADRGRRAARARSAASAARCRRRRARSCSPPAGSPPSMCSSASSTSAAGIAGGSSMRSRCST